MTRPVVKLTVTPLEDRVNPAKFTVSLLSDLTGDDGDTIATHTGSLALTSAVTVDAADPTAAVKAAFSGTIHVTLGGATTDYTFGSSANTPDDPFRIDVDGEQALIRLEDMAGQTGCDYDYNDRSWAMMVRETGAETVVSTSSYTWASPFNETADVTVTVTQDKPGYEGLYYWNYHVANNDFGAFSGPGQGMAAISLVVGAPAGIANAQTTLSGWVWQPNTYYGDPNGVSWQTASAEAPQLLPGQSADFSFTTPVCGIGEYAGSEMAVDGFAMTGGGNIKAPEPMIRSVSWWLPPDAFGSVVGGTGTLLGQNPNAGGGQRIFPEKRTPTSATVSDKVDVWVELSQPVTANTTVNMYLFDVDDPSSNDVKLDNEANETDNKGTTPDLGAFTATVPAGKSSVKVTRQVSHQPGDNFRAVATIDPNVALGTTVKVKKNTPANGSVNYDDGSQAGVYHGGGTGAAVAVKDDKTVTSPLLTVWRTLYVERDHMDKPPNGEPFAGAGKLMANSAKEGDNQGDDDVDPNGPIPDPPIDWLTTIYADAYVRVLDLGTYNTNKASKFVHNMSGIAAADAKPANDIRDVKATNDFWTAQVWAAYEDVEDKGDPANMIPPIMLTNDPTEPNKRNVTFAFAFGALAALPNGPVAIYTETYRDFIANPYNDPATGRPYVMKPLGTLLNRSVAHEVTHLFGIVHGAQADEGVMDLDHNLKGEDADNRLSVKHLNAIRSAPKPKG